MALSEKDLPKSWVKFYGAFMAFGDEVVLATCRTCLALIASDHFPAHTEWHESCNHAVVRGS